MKQYLIKGLIALLCLLLASLIISSFATSPKPNQAQTVTIPGNWVTVYDDHEGTFIKVQKGSMINNDSTIGAVFQLVVPDKGSNVSFISVIKAQCGNDTGDLSISTNSQTFHSNWKLAGTRAADVIGNALCELSDQISTMQSPKVTT